MSQGPSESRQTDSIVVKHIQLGLLRQPQVQACMKRHTEVRALQSVDVQSIANLC